MIIEFRRVLILQLLLTFPFVADAQTLKAGYISKDRNYLPFFIAQKIGFHAKEGIQVDLVSIGRSDIQFQALVAGELHFANINADNIIIWNERTNGNLKVAAESSNAAPYLLIGAKNIKRIEDFKGQRLGVNRLPEGAASSIIRRIKFILTTATPRFRGSR